VSPEDFVSHRTSIHPRDMQGDIRQFATEAVREHHRRGRLLAKNPSLVDDIIERLADSVDGMCGNLLLPTRCPDVPHIGSFGLF
jgi:hypothetical protein